MEGVKYFTQAYSQTPWRKQVRYLAIFLLLLVLVSAIASIYLTVSSRAVSAGHDIQVMTSKIEETKRAISDMETTLAYLTSEETMKERAKDLDYKLAGPDQIFYIEVPGYAGRQAPAFAESPAPVVVAAPTLSPAFTESLVDWIVDNVIKPSGSLLEVTPWK